MFSAGVSFTTAGCVVVSVWVYEKERNEKTDDGLGASTLLRFNKQIYLRLLNVDRASNPNRFYIRCEKKWKTT